VGAPTLVGSVRRRLLSAERRSRDTRSRGRNLSKPCRSRDCLTLSAAVAVDASISAPSRGGARLPGGIRIPNPGSVLTGALTPTLRSRLLLALVAHERVALRRRTNPAVRHRFWCRGDLASTVPEGTAAVQLAGTIARVGRSRRFRRLPWLACRTPLPGVRPPVDSTRVASSSVTAAFQRLARGRTPTYLGGTTLSGRPHTCLGQVSIAAPSLESGRGPHRRARSHGPAASGCQSRVVADVRLSSGHFQGPSTCPRKRVFKSFP